MRAFRPALSGGLFALLAALLVVMATASAADAVTGHRYSRTIGTGGSQKLTSIGGVVARSNADLFVADPGVAPSGLIRRFDQSGDARAPIDTSGQMVGPSGLAYYQTANAEYLYVLGSNPADNSAVVARYNLAGGTPYVFNLSQSATVQSLTSIAVDTDGQLYVSDVTSQSLIRVYDFDGIEQGSFDGTEGGGQQFSSLGGLAVDSANTVYVTEPYTRIQKFAQFAGGTTSYLGALNAPTPRVLSVDRGTNDVFVIDSPDGVQFGITRYDSAGNREQRFAEGPDVGNFPSLSIAGTGPTVFAANPATTGVDVYNAYTAPDAVTGDAPAAPGSTSADVTGTVNPQGTEASYQYEYGKDTTYGTRTDPVPVGDGVSDVDAPGTLGNLVPNTTYHYRVVAIQGDPSNPNADRNPGVDRTFTTAAAPPTVSGESATAITFNTATLNASVDPNNSTPLNAYFEYDTDPNVSDGERTPDSDPSNGGFTIPGALTARIEKLEADTTYYYRVVAENGVGQGTTGAVQEFKTAPAPPVATAAAVTAVSGGSAQFSGSVDTRGLSGKVSFLVAGKNSPYSAVTAPQDLTAASGARAVAGSIAGLPPGGVFEVRVSIETSTGTVLSDPATFSTASLAVPVVSPPLTVDPFPYGCAAPRLAQPSKTLKAGRSATLTGSDLGVTGTVAFGSRNAEVTDYSASRVTVVVPSAASGRVPVTVTCGRVSNTVTARVSSSEPSNRFTVSTSTKKTAATVKVKVPGRGAVSVSGSRIGRKSASPKKAGTSTLKVALTKKGRAALRKAKSKRLSVRVAVRYRPSGGSTRTAYRTLTFRR